MNKIYFNSEKIKKSKAFRIKIVFLEYKIYNEEKKINNYFIF